MDCNSFYEIYLISCTVCEMQYVGSIITKFRIRFNNNRSRLTNYNKLNTDSKMKDDCIQAFQSGRKE